MLKFELMAKGGCLSGLLIVLICFFCACTGRPVKKSVKEPAQNKDACNLDLYIGNNIENNLGCGNCHHKMGDRMYRNIPTFSELSAMDSLKLQNFIFKTKHKGMYPEYYKVKRPDTLSECEVQNLMHYIKDINRESPKS